MPATYPASKASFRALRIRRQCRTLLQRPALPDAQRLTRADADAYALPASEIRLLTWWGPVSRPARKAVPTASTTPTTSIGRRARTFKAISAPAALLSWIIPQRDVGEPGECASEQGQRVARIACGCQAMPS
jgi:hypothetical protein